MGKKKWTQPQPLPEFVDTCSETAFQRAIFWSDHCEIGGIKVQWLDIELPVDLVRKGRGHCVDLIGRADDNRMVLCELKFGKPGNGCPIKGREQLLDYYYQIKKNCIGLDKDDCLHHPNALEKGTFQWKELASDDTLLVLAANDDYWNYWKRKNLTPPHDIMCCTIDVDSNCFKKQKEANNNNRYKPYLSQNKWSIISE